MQTLAIAFLTLHLTDSGAALGLATGAKLLPFLLFGPYGGVVADRVDKRRLLFLTQTASGTGSLLFGVLTLAGVMTFPLLLGISLVLGCLTVLDNPARQSMLPELVDRDLLGNAVTLNSISLNAARMVGSVVGGVAVAAVGPAACFLVNAATFGAVILSLALMHTDEIVPAPVAPRARGQVREGFSYVARTPELAVPLVVLTVTGILAYEFPTTLPLLATDAFGGDAGTYGVMAALMAAGSVVGGLWLARRSTRTPDAGDPQRRLAVVCLWWGAAILLAALAPNLVTACLALVVVGYGTISLNSSTKTTLQLTSRPEMRGRVMALWALAWAGSSAVGAPLVGWIAEELGSRAGLVAGGLPTVLLGVLLLLHRPRPSHRPHRSRRS